MSTELSRRDFVTGTGAAAAGLLLAGAIANRAHAAGDDVIKIGLVGCGGRGTGAASQALKADKNIKLVAIADAFSDRLESSLSTLKKQSDIGSKIEIEDGKKFIGFDAAKNLIEKGGVDVVLLCEPPHFRPAHLKMAIDAGKHVFCEKPVAVDAPGVRSVIATCEEAKKKKLSVVSGLCWRYFQPKREAMKQVHDGAIGDIIAIQSTYHGGGLWMHARKPEWSDMEWQVRNWTYFTWLAGDLINEQHIHSLDKAAWAMKDEYPIKASAIGGRQARTAPEYGQVYDHFSTCYEYASGVKIFSSCRQYVGCDNNVSDFVMGTKGTLEVFKQEIKGEKPWKYAGGKPVDMYQQEHNELFASVRSGNPINNGDYMAKSTLMACMGRQSAYTGKTVTYEQMLASTEDLSPAKYEWGALATPPVAIPGTTKFS